MIVDCKDKVHLEIYDVTTWLTNNYNTHIAQYLKYLAKWLDNGIWSDNEI